MEVTQPLWRPDQYPTILATSEPQQHIHLPHTWFLWGFCLLNNYIYVYTCTYRPLHWLGWKNLSGVSEIIEVRFSCYTSLEAVTKLKGWVYRPLLWHERIFQEGNMASWKIICWVESCWAHLRVIMLQSWKIKNRDKLQCVNRFDLFFTSLWQGLDVI